MHVHELGLLRTSLKRCGCAGSSCFGPSVKLAIAGKVLTAQER